MDVFTDFKFSRHFLENSSLQFLHIVRCKKPIRPPWDKILSEWSFWEKICRRKEPNKKTLMHPVLIEDWRVCIERVRNNLYLHSIALDLLSQSLANKWYGLHVPPFKCIARLTDLETIMKFLEYFSHDDLKDHFAVFPVLEDNGQGSMYSFGVWSFSHTEKIDFKYKVQFQNNLNCIQLISRTIDPLFNIDHPRPRTRIKLVNTINGARDQIVEFF